jgi:hypothetical protein
MRSQRQRFSAPSDQDLSDERLLSPVEAARRLRMQPTTLKAWRLRRWGPSYIAVSRQCIRYRECDLNAWVAAHRVEHEWDGMLPAGRAP